MRETRSVEPQAATRNKNGERHAVDAAFRVPRSAFRLFFAQGIPVAAHRLQQTRLVIDFHLLT